MKKCPYCGYLNEFDDKYCPNCGKAVYKCKDCGVEIESKLDNCPNCNAPISDYDNKTRARGFNTFKLNHLSTIFNRISAITAIVIFALSLAICLGKYLDIANFDRTNDPLFGTLYHYLIRSFVELTNKGISTNYDWANLVYAILKALIVSNNIVIVIIFSIKGIKGSIIDLKKNTISSRKYLYIVFLCFLISLKLLLMFESFNNVGSVSLNNSLNSLLTLMMILILFQLVTTVITSYRRHYVHLLIEKALHGTMMIFVMLIISFIDKEILVINNNALNATSLQYYFLLNIFNNTNSNIDIAIFVGASSLISLQIIELISLSVITIFFTSSFFARKDSFKLKMTIYILTLFEFIVATIQFVILIVLYVLLSVEYKDSNLLFGSYFIANFVLSSLMFSLSIYSFVMSRNRRNAAKTKGTSVTCPHNS